MLVFPQLATGALTQYPARKRRRARTVVNTAADGSTIRLADPAGAATEWELSYTDLTDDEATALQQFFLAAEGSLNGFTFLDPTANLLSANNELDHPIWQTGPQLGISGGIEDPFGGNSGWRLTNRGAAAQEITQTLASPCEYVYCCSVYVRAQTAAPVTLLLGKNGAERHVSAEWRRLTLTGTGEAGGSDVRFGLQAPAGVTIDAFGFQADAQTGASPYHPNVGTGVYQNARFRDDELAFTSTGVNRHSCTIHVIHFNHL